MMFVHTRSICDYHPCATDGVVLALSIVFCKCNSADALSTQLDQYDVVTPAPDEIEHVYHGILNNHTSVDFPNLEIVFAFQQSVNLNQSHYWLKRIERLYSLIRLRIVLTDTPIIRAIWGTLKLE